MAAGGTCWVSGFTTRSRLHKLSCDGKNDGAITNGLRNEHKLVQATNTNTDIVGSGRGGGNQNGRGGGGGEMLR